MSTAPMPSAERLAEPMRSRWSPSIFDDDHVLNDADLELILTAARWAPSWGNSQPWSFLVLPRGSIGHASLVSSLSRGNSGWVPRASAVILAATAVQADPDDDDGRSVNPTYNYYGLGQAVAHLTLQAQALGLFSHQFAGFDQEAAARALGVPDHVRVPVGIAVGARGEPGDVGERDRDRELKLRERKPLHELVHLDRWGESWRGSAQ